MFGNISPEILNLLGVEQNEEQDPAAAPPLPPAATQAVRQGAPISGDTAGLPVGLPLPPTGAQIRAAGGAPGQPVSPNQLNVARATSAPPLSGLAQQLGLEPAQARQSAEIAVQDVGNLFGGLDERLGSMESGAETQLNNRMQAPGLLQPWQRSLLTTSPGDMVQQKLTERFGTGKKGAAKQFLYDLMAGFAYGTNARGILSAQVEQERKFALEIAKRDEALQKQQDALLKARLSDDLARDRAVVSNQLRLAGMAMTDAQKQRIESRQLATDQAKLSYIEQGLDLKSAESRARQDYIKAQTENLSRYRGSREPGWIHASDGAAADTIKQFGFDPVTGGRDVDPAVYQEAKRFYADREKLHAAEWAKAVATRTQRAQRIRLTDVFAADEKGNVQARDTFLVVSPDGSAKVETVPIGEGKVTKEWLFKANKTQADEILSQSQAARDNSFAWETIAQTYLDFATQKPGAKFDTADLTNLPFGALNDNKVYGWGYMNGLFEDKEWFTSGILAKAAAEFRRTRAQYAISGKQVSDIERNDLRNILGPLYGSPQALAKLSLVNYYVHNSNVLSQASPEFVSQVDAVGRAKLIGLATKLTMRRLERDGKATPVTLTEALWITQNNKNWKDMIK